MSTRKRHPDWNQIYTRDNVTSLPWHYPELDPDLKTELARRGLEAGDFLDIGAGAGTQAGALTALGFTVTGTDISAGAVAIAASEHPSAKFVIDDIRHTRLSDPFDFAFDRGCFHVLEPADYPAYVKNVSRLLRPGGLLFLKCFSREEGESEVGPIRFSAEELEKIFCPRLELESLSRAVYQGSREHQPLCWFGVLRRSRHSTMKPS